MRRSPAIHPLICPLQVVVAGTQMLAKVLLGVLQVRLNLDLNHRRKIRLDGDDLRNEVSFRLVETPYPLRLAQRKGIRKCDTPSVAYRMIISSLHQAMPEGKVCGQEIVRTGAG